LQHLLADVAVRERLDLAGQLLALFGCQRRTDHAASVPTTDRPDDQGVDVAEHVIKGGWIAAPPRVN
jgi:hypothetical protein